MHGTYRTDYRPNNGKIQQMKKLMQQVVRSTFKVVLRADDKIRGVEGQTCVCIVYCRLHSNETFLYNDILPLQNHANVRVHL